MLIVKALPDDAENMLLALRRGGIEPAWRRVETAEGLRAALADGRWDAILSDYSLPEFGAPAALEVVRAADPDVPFIVVSGAVGEDAAVAMMRATASDYVLKHNLIRLAPTVEREIREAGVRRAKRAADRAAAHLAAVVESSDDAIISITLDGMVTTWNPAAERLYGWAAAAAIGRPVSFLIPADKVDELAGIMVRLRAGERVGYFETVRMHRDGRRIDVSMTISPVRDASGRIVGVSKTARDIRKQRLAEEALRKSEARYRGLIESVPALVWVSDAIGRQFLHNRRWYEYTGLSPEDSADDRWHEVIHPDDLAGAIAAWDHCKATGEPYVCEYRLRRADGAYRWFLSKKTAVRGPDGIEQWVGVCTDIDDRKRAEEDLRRNADLLAAVAEGTPDAVFVKDEEGKYLLCNPAAARFMGRVPADVLGRTDEEFLDPDSARLVMERDRRVRESGQTETVDEDLSVAGVTRTFLATKAPYRDAAGNAIGVVGVSHDMTERRRLAAERHDLLARLQIHIERMPLAYVLFDADLRITGWNPAAERIFGYGKAEALGKGPFDLVPTAFRQKASEILARIRSGDMTANSVNDNLTKDGRTITCEWYNTPLLAGDGRFCGILCLATDITDRQQLENQFRQAQKMEAIGQLAGGIAHDFNNLLTVISGYSEMMLTALGPDDPHRALVQEVYDAGQRAALLTRQLLTFSRKAVVDPRPLDLNAVVNTAGKLLRRLIGEDIELTTTLASDAPWVFADPGQIEQVVMNLAVNARDAMPRGGRLTIETTQVDLDAAYTDAHAGVTPGRHALLAVSDNGVGMSAEVRQRVFEPFFTTKEPGKGTGLGLATVYGIVSQGGGHVAVYSEPGLGTSFKVYLPAVSRPEIERRSAPPGRVRPGTETVLLVEDEDMVRAMTRSALSLFGYTVLEARGGDDALRLSDSHGGPIDLVITDVVMPGMSGRQVAEAIGARRPGVKVLYSSGYTDDAVVRHGVLKAEAAFLQKPFTATALGNKVREILDGP